MDNQSLSMVLGMAIIALVIIGYFEYRFNTMTKYNDQIDEVWAETDKIWADIDEVWDELSHLDGSIEKHKHHAPHSDKKD